MMEYIIKILRYYYRIIFTLLLRILTSNLFLILIEDNDFKDK